MHAAIIVAEHRNSSRSDSHWGKGSFPLLSRTSQSTVSEFWEVESLHPALSPASPWSARCVFKNHAFICNVIVLNVFILGCTSFVFDVHEFNFLDGP